MTDLFLSGGLICLVRQNRPKITKIPIFVILAKNGSNIVLEIWACGTSQYIAKTLSGHFLKLKLYDGSVLKWGYWFAWSGKTDQKSPKSPFCDFGQNGSKIVLQIWVRETSQLIAKTVSGHFWKLKLYDRSVLKWGNWFAWSGKTDQKSPKSPFFVILAKNGSNIVLQIWACGTSQYVAKTLSGPFLEVKTVWQICS